MTSPLLRQDPHIQVNGCEFYMKFTQQKDRLPFEYPSKKGRLKIPGVKIHQDLKKTENTARGALNILGNFEDELHEKINMVVANIGFVISYAIYNNVRQREFMTFPVSVDSAVYPGEKRQYRKYADIKEILEDRSNCKHLKQQALIHELLENAEREMLSFLRGKEPEEDSWRTAEERSTPEAIENSKQQLNHSETALIYHLNSLEYQKKLIALVSEKIESASSQLSEEELLEKPKIYAVVLDFHSTRVPCLNCAERILGLQNSQDGGFLLSLKEVAGDKFIFPKEGIKMITRATADIVGKSRSPTKGLDHRISIQKKNISRTIINHVYPTMTFEGDLVFYKGENRRTIFFSGTQMEFIHYKRKMASSLKRLEQFESKMTRGNVRKHLIQLFRYIKEGYISDKIGVEDQVIALLKRYPDCVNIKIKGATLLHIALEYGKFELASEIVKLNPKLLTTRDGDDNFPIHTLTGECNQLFTIELEDPLSTFEKYLPTANKALRAKGYGGNTVLHNLLVSGNLFYLPSGHDSLKACVTYLPLLIDLLLKKSPDLIGIANNDIVV